MTGELKACEQVAQWQVDRSEFFSAVVVGIVEDFAEWASARTIPAHPLSDDGEVERLLDIVESGLSVAMVASCNCDHEANISPKPEAHSDSCQYRVLYVAADALADARAAIAAQVTK
jgi:hypothetical protein